MTTVCREDMTARWRENSSARERDCVHACVRETNELKCRLEFALRQKLSVVTAENRSIVWQAFLTNPIWTDCC